MMITEPTTAREAFAKGDRVRESELYPRYRERRPEVAGTGVVVGFGQKDHTIQVIRDGNRTPQAFHFRFWEKVPRP